MYVYLVAELDFYNGMYFPVKAFFDEQKALQYIEDKKIHLDQFQLQTMLMEDTLCVTE